MQFIHSIQYIKFDNLFLVPFQKEDAQLMTRKQLFTLILIGLVVGLVGSAANIANQVYHGRNSKTYTNGFQKHLHYEVLSSPMTRKSNNVSVFFYYGSPGSVQLMNAIIAWNQTSASQLNHLIFEYIPGTLNSGWLNAARAFYTFSEMGHLDGVHPKLFDVFDATNDVNFRNAIESILIQRHVQSDAFWEIFYSSKANVRLKELSGIAKSVNLESVPTIIVGGKYKINTASFASWDDVFELIVFLSKIDDIGTIK